MKRASAFLILIATNFFSLSSANAHHSFAAFDIENKIEKTGVLTKYKFAQPHITMALEVSLEDGTKENWEIESLVPRRWNAENLDADFVKVGDAITILGWPARNGSTEMMLSTIISEKGELVARDEIRQQQ